MGLVSELEKIIELEKYKRGFLSYITRYLHIAFELDYKYAKKLSIKYFGSWFLDAMRIGKVVNFLPVEDIVRIKDLKYLAYRMGKVYGEKNNEKACIPEYKPFVFVFKFNRYRSRFHKYSPKVKTIISPDKKYITFEVNEHFMKQKPKYDLEYSTESTIQDNAGNPDDNTRSLSIHMLQYKRLRKLYKGPPGFVDDNIFILLMKYNFIGTRNNHLSVPPSLINSGMTELFGSPLNTISKNYCSALHIDKAFGSKGSFFNTEFTAGMYLANPPFVEDIMIDMTEKILKALDNVKGLIIFVVIPVWSEGAEERGVTYIPLDLIKDSEYLRSHKILKQDDYPFYDYYRDIYVSVTDFHLILLTNITNPDIEEYMRGIMKKWNQFSELVNKIYE